MRVPALGMAVILASAAGLVAATPGRAQLCVTLTIFQDGVPQTAGHCEPLLDDLPTKCSGDGATVVGYGASAELCGPRPVATRQLR